MNNNKYELDIWENLLIRATKGLYRPRKTILRRCRRIWRMRCELPSGFECDYHIAQAMIKILVNRKTGFKIEDLVYNLDPEQNWKYELTENTPYWERVITILSKELLSSETSQWLNYRSPAKFRNRVLTFGNSMV